MLTTISLTGFRALDQVDVPNLGRVNVLVGENGAGKTSLLEAVRLLGARGHPAALLASAVERGECEVDEADNGTTERVAILRHAFHGRKVDGQSKFVVSAEDSAEGRLEVSCEVFDAARQSPPPMTGIDPGALFPDWAIRITHSSERVPTLKVPVAWSRANSQRLGLPEPPMARALKSSTGLPVFLRANELNDLILAGLWDAVVATPAKEAVVASLQRLEPAARDVDLRSGHHLPFRSRVSVRLTNGEEATAPIGSLGGGFTWLFALALGAAATPNQMLLIDDIDAGLHHRAMDAMWTMVMEAARRRDLQVFATTHSIDCLTSLRRACERDDRRGEDVRVIRLVKGGRAAITFTADELATAIEGEVEVRG